MSFWQHILTRPFLLLALVIAIVGIAGVLTQRYLWNTWLPLQTYRSDELGFEIQIPAGWKTQKAIEYQQIAFMPGDNADSDPKPKPGVALTRNQPVSDPGSLTPDHYFSQLERTLRQSLEVQEEDMTSLERYRETSRKRTKIGWPSGGR